jgi:hypothetical protein
MVLSLTIANIFFQNQCYHNYAMANRVKGTLISSLNKKITTLSSFVIKKNNLGKILNILSADMNII